MKAIVGIFFVLGLGLVVVNYIVICTGLGSLTVSDNLEILILAILAITTFWYAKSTKELSATTSKSYDLASKSHGLAVEAEMNSVLPFITLTIESVSPIEIRIVLQNDGKGPAMNLRIWINGDDPVFNYLRGDGLIIYLAAIGANKTGYAYWNNNRGVLPDYGSGFDIVAQYEDVYERKFQSKLQVVNSNDEELFFIKLPRDEEQEPANNQPSTYP